MKLICANFKMNLTTSDIKNYIETIKNEKLENVVFFPTSIYIKDFIEHGYTTGSQNISFKEFGSITGDISVLQLKDLGIKYTILGHSERREFFNDSKYINAKVNLALKNDIKIILCIGEDLYDYENKNTFNILKNELDDALINNLDLITDFNLIIAYEPIWAIGTGKIPTKEILTEIIAKIKNYLKDTYNLNSKVLYGGSVNLENISDLETINGIDGYLIGGASLNPKNFLSLINKVN